MVLPGRNTLRTALAYLPDLRHGSLPNRQFIIDVSATRGATQA